MKTYARSDSVLLVPLLSTPISPHLNFILITAFRSRHDFYNVSQLATHSAALPAAYDDDAPVADTDVVADLIADTNC